MRTHRYRRTRRSVRGNYVWINGYNVMTILPNMVGNTQHNYVTSLLLPTDWAGGAPTQAVRIERLVYWMKIVAVVDQAEDLNEHRVPYCLFLTDATTPNADAQFELNPLDSAAWPIWALGNDRILKYGTCHFLQSHGNTVMDASHYGMNDGIEENVQNLKLGRRMNADDSLRICISQESAVYAAGMTSLWVCEIYSRMCLRIGAK